VVTNGLSRTTHEVLGNLAPLIAELVVVRDNDVLLFLSPLSSFDIWVQNIVPTGAACALASCWHMLGYRCPAVAVRHDQFFQRFILRWSPTAPRWFLRFALCRRLDKVLLHTEFFIWGAMLYLERRRGWEHMR